MGSFTGGQISDMRYREPEEFDGAEERDDLGNPVGGGSLQDLFKQVQLPSPQPSPQQPPQAGPVDPTETQGGDHKQYFDQMHKSIDSLNEAFKQIENLSMPGGQHSGQPPPSQGGGVGKGVSNFGGPVSAVIDPRNRFDDDVASVGPQYF